MNTDWTNFLTSNHASITEHSGVTFPKTEELETDYITALTHLSVIKISGKDASSFLQGQLTCNINELDKQNSFFCAFCNAKGRAISTLLILKPDTDFLLIMPNELVEKVCNKLKMYILRSDVQIENISNNLCLSGLISNTAEQFPSLSKLDFSVTHDNNLFIKFPSTENRYLIIGSATQSINFWEKSIQTHSISPKDSTLWHYLDISAGIAWLSLESTEEYIPQMLNIDKLGGISFNKGCYTGQEIIARTHYLGKAKRELYLGECKTSAQFDKNHKIINEANQQSSGKLLCLQSNEFNSRCLIVMPTSGARLNTFTLNNSNQDTVQIINFQ